MRRKRDSTEEIVNKLREADADLSRGQTVPQACRKIGVTEQTYYRWRREYGGMKVNQAKRLKDLEKENVRLKRVVADQALDLYILKEVASGYVESFNGKLRDELLNGEIFYTLREAKVPDLTLARALQHGHTA